MVTPDFDLIIIGAGPAGLTAAQYGSRASLDVLVVEQLAPGGQALNIEVLENYPGIIPEKSGYDFSEDLRRQAEKFGANFLTETVVSLRKAGDLFTLDLGNGEKRSAYAVILATGTKHHTLNIPGEAEFYGRGVSYCAVCDGPFFKGKKILVVGGGDTACDEAQYLSRLSSRVILIHRREKFRAQKALAERVLRNPAIEVRFNTRLLEIRGEKQVAAAVLERLDRGETYEETAAAVFIFAGASPQTSLVPELKTDENGYLVTDQTMAGSLPGLFVAGDVRATPFRQVVVAAGEGAVAAHSAAAYIDALKGEVYR
ncbi:MAG: FAD-dependent oxidoreductase [Treponema sp.]|jgi:thioredoxin reductase (NADPH)|nr:FAD-dependent oxidoreductase [Treponema sp.]